MSIDGNILWKWNSEVEQWPVDEVATEPSDKQYWYDDLMKLWRVSDERTLMTLIWRMLTTSSIIETDV